MQKNEKIYEGAESKDAKKKIIFKSKKQFGRELFIYDVHKNFKKSKFWTPTHPPSSSPLSTNINFGLNTPYSWTSLIGIQNPPIRGNFESFLENFNNEINTLFLC